MLSFDEYEPHILEPKKVPVKYRYYISILAMTSMLLRLEYNPDTLYIQNGWWDIPLPLQYSDNVAYNQPPSRVAGIGFFEDFNNNLPSIVIDVIKQEIYIIDERHINEINKKTGRSCLYITITFDRAFDKMSSWKTIINEVTSQYEEEDLL